MKRKVLLALVMALVMLVSVIPVFAIEGYSDPEDGYVYYVTSDIESFSELEDLVQARDSSGGLQYGKIVIKGTIKDTDFSRFTALGSGLDTIPQIVSEPDQGKGEYPTNKLPSYTPGTDGAEGSFPAGKNSRTAKSHSIGQDYIWEEKVAYIYSNDGNNDKLVTINHGVTDGTYNMLPYAAVIDTDKDTEIKAADNQVIATVTPDNVGMKDERAYIQYRNVVEAYTNRGTVADYRQGSYFSISKSYTYYVDGVYYSSVALIAEPVILGSIQIVKTDAEDETKNLPGAKFMVYTDEKLTDEATHYVDGEFVKVGEVTTGDDGIVIVEGLLPGDYYVVETEAPSGYMIDSTDPQTVTVKEVKASLTLTGGEGTTLDNIDNDTLSLEPKWDDIGVMGDLTNPLLFKKSVKETTVTVNDKEYYGDVFIKGAGKTVAAAAKEGSELDAVSIAALKNIGDAKFNIYVGDELKATKSTAAEAVQYVNDELIAKSTIDAEGFRNHVKIVMEGENPYFVMLGASDVPTVYFTDTAIIDFTVNKSWINETTPQRGEYLNVQLYQILEGTEDPGTPYGEPVQLTEENGWSYTWEGLPSGGYIYEVREPEVPVSYVLVGVKYTEGETEDGRTLITADMTNSQEVDVVVNKSWKNATPAQIGEYLEVQLFCDGEPFGDPVELNEENAWSFKWEHLEGGHKYEVDEPEIPEGFVKKVADPQTGKDKDGRILITCNITNEHVDEAPSTFDNTTMLLILGGTMLLMAAFLIIKIRKTPTK